MLSGTQELARDRFARALVGVGAIAGAILMIELALTRIFSVTMYYHFAFLAISIALFGLSASGVYVYVMRRTFDRRSTASLLTQHSLLFAVSTVLALAALVRIRVGLELLAREPREDDRHLHAGGTALFHRRRRHFAGDHAPEQAREHRVCRRPDRRGGRMSSAAAAV